MILIVLLVICDLDDDVNDDVDYDITGVLIIIIGHHDICLVDGVVVLARTFLKECGRSGTCKVKRPLQAFE